MEEPNKKFTFQKLRFHLRLHQLQLLLCERIAL